MKQNNYDDFDKMMESVMKKNLGSVHASQDLINKTLLKINEEKNKPQQEKKESKKKPFIIPIAFVSGLAALLIALVGVSVMFFSFNKGKNGTNGLSTRKAATGNAGGSYSEDEEENMDIKGMKIESAGNDESIGEDEGIDEDEDGVDAAVYGPKSLTIDGDNNSSDGYTVIKSYYTDDQVTVGYVASDRNGSYATSLNGYLSSSDYTTPFDSLNNYYYSIQDKVWDSSIAQGNLKDSVKNPDMINPDNKTNS